MSSSSFASLLIHIPASSSADDVTLVPRRALECLAHALQVSVSYQYHSSSSSSSIQGVLTTRHPFTGDAVASSCVGWMGCARALCTLACPASCVTNLWNTTSNSSSNHGSVEAWMESAVQTLVVPIWSSNTNNTSETNNTTVVLQQAVQDYARRIHVYLRRHHATYLVGDSLTAADVCIALWLLQACAQVNVTTLPCRCHTWMETVCRQPMIYPFALVTEEGDEDSKWPTALEEEEEKATIMLEQLTIAKDDEPKVDVAVATTSTTTTTTIEEPVVTTTTTTTTSTKELPATTTTTTTMETTATSTATVTATATSTTTSPSSTSTTPSDNAILQLLQELQLEHEVYTHVPCITAEELVANVPIPPTETHTKNLLLRDKKHGLVLVVVAPSTAVHTKDLGTYLKLPAGTKTNFRLADEATLQQVLQCAPGCVGPLCMVQDKTKAITHLLVDATLFSNTTTNALYTHIHSHPMRNDTSVKVTPQVLMEFWKRNGVLEPILVDFATSSASSAASPATAGEAPKPKTPKPSSSSSSETTTHTINKDKKVVKKGETLLALQWKKDENFAMWYSDVIVLSEMIAYYDISGCYILRPWSYKIWELIQEWFNKEIHALGVENSYFPLFVSQDRLEREKDHVEGFAPEVAWVTKSGDGELAKPIAIRPTSETIMYPAFSDWIRSHRDLPLLLNQWSNVVRWEFKDPTPFLRSREFLWQEGHTAHSTFDEANTMVRAALELYRRVYEELLAVPVIPGYKTEKEKFAGGHTTTTVEAYIAGSGRAIQGATSHHLGQNFGKMFDITFQDEHGQTQTAWQSSWGLTTRTIGVMIMVHGDDTGLVLPPRISPLQVVIVPIISKKLTMEDAKPYCQAILEQLQQANMRVKYDDREMYNPGWKYNHWEQKGVPLRIEVGPRDIEQQQVRVVVRYNGEKFDLSIDGLAGALQTKLDEIQEAMLAKAKAIRDSHVVQVTEWKDFVPNLELNHLVLTPWCGGEHKDWEEWVKTKSREESLNARGGGEEDARTSTSVAAKTLCIPFAQPDLPEGAKCIASGLPATCWVLWGRSY